MESVLRCTFRVCLTALARIILCAALAVIASPQVHAQTARVEGVVRDKSGASVPDAQVEIRAKSYSATATTDAGGAFAFENVPESSGTLSVTAKGFAPADKPWSSSAGTLARVEFVLEPLPLSQQIIVTAARTETPLGETPLSVIQLTRDTVQATPALTLDDKLRQVPGFSLFRRSSSRTANPSSMGVSLRGLGGTATSRALVLDDGIPLNDPFGSWIYWDRVPRESISSVEVAQEGASSLYGSSAMGGVLQFRERAAKPASVSLETSYGNQNTPDFSAWAGGATHGWEATGSGEIFSTDGYYLVPGADRGTADARASSQHSTAEGMISRQIGSHGKIFARGAYLDDSRNNGTQIQINSDSLGMGALGADLQSAAAGSFQLRFYGTFETYHQTFSAVAANRNSEILTDNQTVPAQGVGGSALWNRAVGSHNTLVAGFDAHEEIGQSNDHLYNGTTGASARLTYSGGRQRTIGFFGEDLIHITPTWLISLSARYDHWSNFNGFLHCTPAPLGCTPPFANTNYPDRTYDTFNPRATLLHQLDSHVSWSASAYSAFRGPTLNELYRSFRQGSTFTLGNPALHAEKVIGGEGGVNVVGLDRRLEVRGVFFYNQVLQPIVNATCTAGAPPPCLPAPPAGVTTLRAKENLGRTSAPGFEIDATSRITNRLQFSAGYQYVFASVVQYAANPAVVNLWVAQVPHNVLTFQARYADPSRISFAVTGRFAGKQYDDDLNQFPLDSFFVLDAQASHSFAGFAEVFGAVENAFNARYITGYASTSPLVPQLGLPIVARFGLRLQFPRR
jgi:outer membrane receptor protein involved in Fe transport